MNSAPYPLYIPLGRPRKNVYDALILQMASNGLGQRHIKAAIQEQGGELSQATITRRIAELRNSVLQK